MTKIRSNDVVLWLQTLSSILNPKEVFKAKFSRLAIKRYYSLSREGAFPELLMTRRYKSGLLHIARVR